MALRDDPPSGIPTATEVRVDHRSLAVRRTGSPTSPTLVLLHGLTATAGTNWMHLFEPLSQRFQVLAPDLRGHGRTRVGGRFELSDLADDVALVLDHLEIERAVVGGFSMGGAVAQLLWRRHPDRVAGLLLMSTALRFQLAPIGSNLYGATPAMARLGTKLPASLREPLVTRRIPVAEPALRRFVLADVAASSPWAVSASARALRRFDSRQWAADIDVPTSVVVTTGDRSLRPRAQRALADAIAGATVFEIDGPHAAVMWHPEEAVEPVMAAVEHVATALRD